MPEIASTTRVQRRVFGVDARLVESVGLTMLGAATAFAVSQDDPLVLRGGFPWIALVPMCIGLMHGFLGALASLLFLSLWTFALVYVDASLDVSALDVRLALGILLVGLVPAEVRDRFIRENESLLDRLANADERLEGLSRSHSLLLASHRKLERAAISDESSLVANFERLRERLRGHLDPISVVLRGAQDLLSLFAAHGLVQSAAILHCRDGKVARHAIASIGDAAVDPDHPLVEAAIAGRCVATVRELDPLASGVADASVLAVVPLVDAHDRVWGVVIILEMPFIALRDDHLRVLLSIGSSLADVFSEASERNAAHAADAVRAAPPRARTLTLVPSPAVEEREASHGHAE